MPSGLLRIFPIFRIVVHFPAYTRRERDPISAAHRKLKNDEPLLVLL